MHNSTMNESEFLELDELVTMTGYKQIASQREWLDKNGWSYVINAAGRPIVGRWYTRMRLSGIKPTAIGIQPAWQPDFSVFETKIPGRTKTTSQDLPPRMLRRIR